MGEHCLCKAGGEGSIPFVSTFSGQLSNPDNWPFFLPNAYEIRGYDNASSGFGNPDNS